jgi:hypothetical protein
MSDKKYADNDPERTLLTLEQLSQTIEVMTSVVNRLRRHLSDQIKTKLEDQELQEEVTSSQEIQQRPKAEEKRERESFVVEISQQEVEPIPETTKTLH